MRKIDLKIEIEELSEGGLSHGLMRAAHYVDQITEKMLTISVGTPEVIEIMKNLINHRIMLERYREKMNIIDQYISKLEKDLNINQEPPKPYCYECDRGDV